MSSSSLSLRIDYVVGFVLLLLIGSNMDFLRYFMGSIDIEAGNPWAQTIWTLSYGITALLLMPLLPRAAYLWAHNKSLLLLLGIVILSVAWSVWPEGTMRRAFTCAGTFLVATYLATRFSLKELVFILASAMGVIALISLLLVFLAPDLGIMSGVHEGKWRGIFSHKNILGRHMTLSILINFIALKMSSGRLKLLFGSFLLVSLMLLAFSQSTTAAITLLLVSGGWAGVSFWMNLKRRAPYLAPGFAVLALALGGALAFWLPLLVENILLSLGKTPDLTGRTLIWQGVVTALQARPWLGYGYDVFWDGGRDLAHSFVGYLLNWDAPHAHNGVLELALNTGLLGVALFLFNLLGVSRRVLGGIQSVQQPPIASAFLIVSLLLTLVLNFSEVTLLQQNNIFWVLYLVTALKSVGLQELYRQN